MNSGDIVNFIFTASMAVYFIYSFLLPTETNFWLVREGFQILFIESFLTLAISAVLVSRAKVSDSTIDITLIAVIAFATLAIIVTNPWNLIYLAFSLIAKEEKLKNKNNVEIEESKIGSIILILILGVPASMALGQQLTGSFPEQSQAYITYMHSTGRFSGEGFDNPISIVIWGVILYLGTAIIEYAIPKISQSAIKVQHGKKIG